MGNKKSKNAAAAAMAAANASTTASEQSDGAAAAQQPPLVRQRAPMDLSHRRTAGMYREGDMIDDAVTYWESVTTNDEDYTTLKALYDGATPEEQARIRQILKFSNG